MIGAYNKINDSQANMLRKLTDYHIFTQGRHLEIVRIHVEEDVWGESEGTLIDTLNTMAVLTFPPGEMPLIRLRDLTGGAKVDTSAMYFYDILPVEAYFKWEDKIETGDIFYFSVIDDEGNKTPVIFKVMDGRGAFSSQLIWRKFLCAPVRAMDELPPETIKAVMSEMQKEERP